MKIYKELLEIAKKDLDSSKLLYENEFYPQAMFNYHQSLEKITKSFSLANNIITENDLKEYNHKPFTIFRNLYKNLFGFFKEQIKTEGVLENNDLSNNDISKFDLFVDEANDNLDAAQSNQRKYLNIAEEELVESLDLIKKLENNFMGKNNDYNSEDDKQKIDQLMLVYIYLGKLSMLISSSHATYSRYVFPDEGQTPSKIYNKKHSIIKNYNDIHNILKKCVSSYEELIEDGYLPYDISEDLPFFNAKIKDD
ncbi:MAG: HEPN domain-containing protein [Bacillota bacterium]